jgi:hypothetical protein
MDSATACHMSFWTNANIGTSNLAERMRIDSSGNVSINTTAVSYSAAGRGNLTLGGSSGILAFNLGGVDKGYLGHFDSSMQLWNSADSPLLFATNSAERMRITSGGDFLVGTTVADITSGVGYKYIASATTPYIGIVVNTSGSISNYHYFNTNATNNGYRFYVNVNGGISNYSANDVNLSDERTKTNIELASSYLAKICSIPVKTFNYKDEPAGEQKSLGVIAQDVEKVAPELVDTDGWKDPAPEGEEPLKSIYTTDLMFALMKSIQELNAKVEAQAAVIALIKSK